MNENKFFKENLKIKIGLCLNLSESYSLLYEIRKFEGKDFEELIFVLRDRQDVILKVLNDIKDWKKYIAKENIDISCLKVK